MKRTRARQLQRCVMQVGYTTPKGAVIQVGDICQGSQAFAGGPVEIAAPLTSERVCFSARECGLPVPEIVIEDLAA